MGGPLLSLRILAVGSDEVRQHGRVAPVNILPGEVEKLITDTRARPYI